MEFVGIIEKLSFWAKLQPEKKVWTFLNAKCSPVQSYTYQDLYFVIDKLAKVLISNQHIKKGDRILLVFLPGLDFMVAFLACLKADLIAVPVFPPDPRKLQKDLHHFVSIQQSCGAKVALTNAEYNFVKRLEEVKNIFTNDKWPELQWLVIDNHIARANRHAVAISNESYPTLDSIAFLQYTSGSTNEPKGVMISHRNLAHNLNLIINELKADQSTINVSWLPQYHDMGLIGSYLGVLFCGGTGYYFSPIDFLKSPILWIQVLSNFRATHTQAPNFAYSLVARKFLEFMKGANALSIDLSPLRHMINAAEPVNYDNVMNFYRVFSSFGLQRNVIFPTYGLAEHTVFVCSGCQMSIKVKKSLLEQNIVEVLEESQLVWESSNDCCESNDEQMIVSCGECYADSEVVVRIVNPDSLVELNEGMVGEVWVSSLSKAVGYWDRLDSSRETFHAMLLEEKSSPYSSKNEYLRTGDLGFKIKNQLYICGRLKDLIIIGGSNHYPQDIERSIENLLSDVLRMGCSAAFSLKSEHGTEEIVYIAEIKEDVSRTSYDSIVQSCQQIVSKEHGLSFSTVCLLACRTIPKTTSGKIARSWCRKAFIEKRLHILFQQNENKNYLLNEITTPQNDPSTDLLMSLTPQQIRQMSLEDLADKLQQALIHISSSGPVKLGYPVDKTISLTSMGLDSMTIVQFKGVVENRFYTDIPDEFVFSKDSTISELAIAVQVGHLTNSQINRLQQMNAKDDTVIVVANRQPLCPWFTCCY